MKLNCVIVDDELLAITIIDGYLKKIPYIEVIGKFQSAIPVYEFLKENQVDILFLDVEMPNITGIEFIKSLSNPPKVVLTTANKNYAIEGFNLNVDDYILKPVSFDRLVKSVNRLYEDLTAKNTLEVKSGNKDYIYLKENKKMVRVYFKNILYFESLKDYVKVVTTCKTVLTKQVLSNFELELNSSSFLRIHRSYIVALNKIDAYTLSSVDIGTSEIPIGRKYKESVIEILDKLNKINTN
jgi:DNA-binding LytR/AlgR family response regulator